jgi:hypothetical protein
MNIKIAKAYRTTSGEALCVLTRLTPIEIKAAETARLYHITRDRQNRQLDYAEEPKDWTHPADLESTNKVKKRNIMSTYTLTETRTNTESVRGLLYTYKTN